MYGPEVARLAASAYLCTSYGNLPEDGHTPRARCLSFYGTGVYKIVKEGIDGEAGNGLDTCLACDIFPM